MWVTLYERENQRNETKQKWGCIPARKMETWQYRHSHRVVLKAELTKHANCGQPVVCSTDIVAVTSARRLATPPLPGNEQYIYMWAAELVYVEPQHAEDKPHCQWKPTRDR